MQRFLSKGVLAIMFVLVGVHGAAAQTTDTFMLIPGIPGESTDRGHQDWIDVFSITQSFSGDRKGSACTVALSKRLDRSGPPLWLAAVTGQTFNEVRIEILKPGGQPYRVYELILANASVTSIQSSPSELIEQLTLTGSTATLRYYPQLADGSTGAAVSSTVSCR